MGTEGGTASDAELLARLGDQLGDFLRRDDVPQVILENLYRVTAMRCLAEWERSKGDGLDRDTTDAVARLRTCLHWEKH